MDKKCWYAVQVYLGREASCESLLRWKMYEVFLPRCFQAERRSTRAGGRLLFPGYLFCKLTDQTNGLILTTPGCVRVLGAAGKPAAVSDDELDRIRKITETPAPSKPYRYLPAGCTVQIENGPLVGLSGILLSEPTKRRLVVSISLLHRSVAVELNEQIRVTPLKAFDQSVDRPTIPELAFRNDHVEVSGAKAPMR